MARIGAGPVVDVRGELIDNSAKIVTLDGIITNLPRSISGIHGKCIESWCEVKILIRIIISVKHQVGRLPDFKFD